MRLNLLKILCSLLLAFNLISLSAQIREDSTNVTIIDNDSATISPPPSLLAESDSLNFVNPANTKSDSSRSMFLKILFPGKRPPYNPEIAWRRSAILPGWGQLYNKSYWKLPLVYGAYGAIGYAIFFNHTEYNRFRAAFLARTDDDSTTVDNEFSPNVPDEGLRTARDRARRDRDLAILGALLIHVLQVVEAFVDAHLKDFDVSEDLSLKIGPAIPPHRTQSISPFLLAGAQITLSF